MDALAAYNHNELAQSATFAPALFEQFLAWIDRPPKTARTYLTNLRQFAAWLSFNGITAPTRTDIINYRNWLLEEHEAIELHGGSWIYRRNRAGDPVKIKCKPTTAAQYLRSVCQFFKWAEAEGLYPNIAANIHAPKIQQGAHRKEALTPSEVVEIENSIKARAAERESLAHEVREATAQIKRIEEQNKRLYAMYLLAVNAGLRTCEISRANVKDLEKKGGRTWLYIWGKGHTDADQRKALAPEVAEAINDYLRSRSDRPKGNSPLFVATGNRSGGKRLAPTTISTMLKRAMQDAGYNSERITAHSLRHTAGTAVQEMTGNLYATQRYMRHSNPATTEIYLHTNEEMQEAAISSDLYAYYHQHTKEE